MNVQIVPVKNLAFITNLTTVIFNVKSMTRVLFYFTFSDARTVILLGLF